MKLQFELGSEGRKPLVKAVGEVLGDAPKYLGAPGFCYSAGGVVIDKDGGLDMPDSVDVNWLVIALGEKGFARKEEEYRFAIEMPAEGFSETAVINLEKLIASKATLIRKAIGANSLDVVKTDDRLRFDWFSVTPSPEEAHAYASFITKLCELAKRQQRVTGKAATADNERYTFRCFLLKLGFIGDEYKADRRILLSKLSGNPAFKNGKPES